MTYFALNLFVLIVIISIVLLSRYKIITRRWLITLVSLLIMTAIFDSLIIATKIVAYDSAKILDVYIAKAPIEDFAYTIVGMLWIPLLWSALGGKHD